MARQPLNAYLTRVLPGGALTMNPGGQLYIYEEGTTDEANVWNAKVGGDIVSQPLSADADGSFPGLWLEDDRDYDRVVVGDSLNATQAWRLRKGSRYVIYPRDYGAVEDGETDETDALRDCIDDAIAHDKDVTVAFRPITYIVDGDPVTDRVGNAILPIVGENITESITLEGQGLGYNQPRRTILKTNRTTDTYDADLGPPSVIGGQTEEAGSGGILSSGPVTLRGISVEVPNNPAIAGIDAISFGGVILDRSGVIAGDGSDATETPANEWAFGLRLPGAFAFGLIDLRGFKSRQMYAGIVVRKADHIMFGAGSGAVRCVIGLAFEEHDTEGGPPFGGGYIQLDACKYLLAGWNPVDGVKSIGTTMTRRVISGLRIEAEPNTTAPFAEVASVLDANDKLVGRISLHRGGGDFFSGQAQGTITGAGNLDIYNPVNPNLATLKTTAPANVDLMTSQLVIWLDDTPGAVKVMFKAKDSAGTPVTGQLGVSTAVGAETHSRSASLSAAPRIFSSGEVPAAPPVGAGMAGSNLYLWGGPNASTVQGTGYSTASLNQLEAWGFEWIHVSGERLRGFGGDVVSGVGQDFRGSAAPATGNQWSYQRLIENDPGVEDWLGRGKKIYFHNKLPSKIHTHTAAIVDWWDDAGWTTFCARINERAAFADWMGLHGMSFDLELHDDGSDPSGSVSRGWWWNYDGNTHTQAQNRAKARARGAQMMQAMIDGGLGGAQFMVYNMYPPGSFGTIVSLQAGAPNIKGCNTAGEPWLQWDFYQGMMETRGYGKIHTNTAQWQKSTGISEGANNAAKWANGCRYEVNNIMAEASQVLDSDDWYYAQSRFHWAAFAWLDEIPNAAPGSFFYKDTAAFVTTELDEKRKWCMDQFPIFDFSGFNTADYKDHANVSYTPALENASTVEVVDSTAPTLPAPTLGGSTITGTATDDYAILAVIWEDNLGGTGAAEHTFQILTHASSDPDYPMLEILTWRVNWTIQRADINPAATSVTIHAVDMHRLKSSPRVVSGL